MGLPALRHTFARNGAIREHLTLDDHGLCKQACQTGGDDHHLAWPEGDHGMDVLLLRTASLLQGQLLRCIVNTPGSSTSGTVSPPGYGINARFTGAMVTDTIVVANSHPPSTSLGQ